MKSVRLSAILLAISGAILVFSILKQIRYPGMLEFALITLAHLFLAVGVFILSLKVLSNRALGIVLGGVWSLGWLFFHGNELFLLLFVLPPPGFPRALPQRSFLEGWGWASPRSFNGPCPLAAHPA